jgi:hypothetical protein
MKDKVTWFLEEDVFEENLEPLKNEIVRQGFGLKSTGYVPFGSDSYLKDFSKDDCIIFYGSLNLARRLLLEKMNVHPYVYCTLWNYECKKYYAYLGKFLLNANYIMLPYSELKRNKDFLFEKLGQDGAFFVRPSAGDKPFTGQLVCQETFDKDYERLGFYDVLPECLVVVAEPRNIINEWRFVVVKGKIVASSPYKKSESVPNEALKLAEEVISTGYEPDLAWTVDVCQTTSGAYFLLEINSFSCSGLYQCDKEAIVREVSRVTWEQHEELENLK